MPPPLDLVITTIVVKTAAEWAADTSTYDERQLLITSDEYFVNTTFPRYKIGIEGGMTWDNLDYFEDVKVALNTHTADNNNPHNTTKAQVGLANADNTSDVNKPVSTAQAAAIALKQSTSEKAQPGGYASLDGGGKIPTSQLPAIAVTDVFVVNSQAAQLALTAEEGDVAVRTDLNRSYIQNGGTSGTMADWQEMLTPTDAVLSVNGQTGAVTLTTTNIAEGTNLYFTNARAIAAVITGFAAGAGTVTDADTILQAINKIVGNIGLKQDTLTATNFGAFANALTDKATPVDADYFNIVDSAASNVQKKLSWANLKTTLFNTWASFTVTLTNKRITKRFVTVTQSATPTINTDNTDIASITGLAQAITSFTTNLSGTPTSGQLLSIEITDNGTARALAFGASFAASGTLALPTTTVINTTLRMLFSWDATLSKWVIVAVA